MDDSHDELRVRDLPDLEVEAAVELLHKLRRAQLLNRIRRLINACHDHGQEHILAVSRQLHVLRSQHSREVRQELDDEGRTLSTSSLKQSTRLDAVVWQEMIIAHEEPWVIKPQLC